MASNDLVVTRTPSTSLLLDNLLKDLERDCYPNWKPLAPHHPEDEWWVAHAQHSSKADSFLVTTSWDDSCLFVKRYGKCPGTSGKWDILIRNVVEYARNQQQTAVWALTYNRDLALKNTLMNFEFQIEEIGRKWSDNFSVLWSLKL
jgi:hypothetical protein